MSDTGSPFDARAWGSPQTPDHTHDTDPHHPTGREKKRPGVRLPKLAWKHPKTVVVLVVALVLGVGFGLTVKAFLVEPFTVPSESMNPTLKTGDRLVVEKISYRTGEPRRGHVVVFDGTGTFDDEGESNFYVKRVIAIGGDTVVCCDKKDRIRVNGTPVIEEYLKEQGATARFKKVTVPDGHLFLLGDNRANSSDSRDRGTVPANKVVGKVFARIYPWKRIDSVPRS